MNNVDIVFTNRLICGSVFVNLTDEGFLILTRLCILTSLTGLKEGTPYEKNPQKATVRR